MSKKQKEVWFDALKSETKHIHKLVKQSFKKNDAVHELRVLFKKIKAHIVLLHALGEVSVDMSDHLRVFYKNIGLFRDAEIFRELCKTHAKWNKIIAVLGEDRVAHAKKKLQEYKASISTKEIANDIEKVVDDLIKHFHSFDTERVKAWLESFLEQTQHLINQLLQSTTITNVGLHTMRKHIKKMMYLLHYLRLEDDVKYAPIEKVYKKLALKLGERNDMQLLAAELEALPRKGKEAKIVEKIFKKEEKQRKKIVKKLRSVFHVSAQQVSEKTARVPESTKITTKKELSPDTQKSSKNTIASISAPTKKTPTKKESSPTKKESSPTKKPASSTKKTSSPSPRKKTS